MDKQQTKPLLEMLEEFTASNLISLHVPGHKHGELSNLPKILKDGLRYDLTELYGLDDLHYPTGVIKDAELLLTTAHATEQSYFLVNGSTVGNLAMVLATCSKGDIVFVQRNSHKSMHNAIELAEVEPVYLTPSWDEITQTAVGVSLQLLKKAHSEHKKVKALLLTSPNYYGLYEKDLPLIIEYCRKNNILVLVDEAHGAHFGINNYFPISTLSYGAHIVVQSAHKTLPAMTMGAYLHVNDAAINLQRIKKYLAMLQSSSPSYMVMASLDDARHYKAMYTNCDAIYFEEKRSELLKQLQSFLTVIETPDKLKLLIRVNGYTGFQLQKKLEQQDVYCELADIQQVLLILPLLKKNSVFSVETLVAKIKKACTVLLQEPTMEIPHLLSYEVDYTKPALLINKALEADYEWIQIARAENRIAAETLIPYPPGVPLFVPGERLTTNMIEEIKVLQNVDAYFQGGERLHKKLIKVVKEG